MDVDKRMELICKRCGLKQNAKELVANRTCKECGYNFFILANGIGSENIELDKRE